MIRDDKPSLRFLMIDLAGTELTAEDIDIIKDKRVVGVILFSRNYVNKAQLKALIKSIREVRIDFLIAVDQEGGRVQRFRDEFTELPAFRDIGQLYESDPEQALELAVGTGYQMASELIECDVDFSFTPVVDLDYGLSEVIGTRSFHRDPEIVSRCAISFMMGMHAAGMAAVMKHFPGHGGVKADSHHEIPVDDRDLETLATEDCLPFQALSTEAITAVMPAHVIYSKVDDKPAGFSKKWLQEILRGEMDFQGIIISDDLTMEGASKMGDYPQRVDAALEAGCDMVLVCNNRQAVKDILAQEIGDTLNNNGILSNLKHSIPRKSNVSIA